MSVKVQLSLWESAQVSGQTCTSFAPVGVSPQNNRRMTTRSERIEQLPVGQQVLRDGRRWRAWWTVRTSDGRNRRKSKRFDSAAEALAFLDALPRRPMELATERRTLRDAVAQLRDRGRGGAHTNWVMSECADLLSVTLSDPALPSVIDSILTRRAQRRQPQGKPSNRWELNRPVRRTDSGWESLTDGVWVPIHAKHFAPSKREAFAERIDALLTHLTAGGSGLERDLPVPREALRSPAVQPLLRRSQVHREPVQAVSRLTVLGCRSMLSAALPPSLRDAIPDPREVRVVDESPTRKRKRALTRALGGRGLEPDPVMIERVLREARRVGSLPPADGESLTHLSARRAVALIAATGLRSGEARALRWGDIDLTANRLWVDASLDQHTEQRKSPKTEESQRELRVEFASLRGLGDGLLDDLRAWRGNAPETAWVFPREGAKPVRREALLDAVDELRTAMGLPKGLRVHDLRHCWARFALHLCGVDVAKVSKALGHASIVITLGRYGSAVEGVME